MTDSTRKLIAPKKKKRVRAQRHAPFPVPIQSIKIETEKTGRWHYYTGQLQGSSVVVTHSGDIHHLYNMGFFGKGNLSRSGFEHRNSFQTMSSLKAGEKPLEVMRRQRYIRHLNWQRQKQAHCEESTETEDLREYDSDKDHGSLCTWEQDCQENMAESNKDDFDEHDEKMDKVSDDKQNLFHPEEGNEILDDGPSDFIAAAETSKLTETSAEALWDAQEGDADFWGSEDLPDKKPESHFLPENHQVHSAENVQQSKKLENSNLNPSDTNDLPHRDFQCNKTLPQSENESDNKHSFQNSGKSVDLLRTTYSDTLDHTQKISLEENISEIKTETSNKICDSMESIALPSSGIVDQCEKSQVTENNSAVAKPALPLDPLCESHDPGGDIYVVSDSDSEDEESHSHEYSEFRWKRVIKHDPYKMKEHLQLTLEEAFFLSYGLGCLVCLNQHQKALTIPEMWTRFSGLKKSFLPHYIAYHHFRSKGWVPKLGIKFGVDYILYKEGPPFYHASYSVVVRYVNGTSLEDKEDDIARSQSWRSLSGLNRITENVGKELMYCFVIPPPVFTTETASSPKCIPQFKVQEMIVKRWVPAQERENKDMDDIL